jgi:RNA polymerase sigma factor (sigma-70 family)
MNHLAAPGTDGVVLVVDDDLSVREGLEALLRAAGLPCALYASAADFLAAARPDAPCCVVLDVHLPESSGLDVAAELRRRGDAIPIIFITGRGTIPMSVQAMKLGAVEFLPKPFGEETLLQAIDQAMALDRAARAARADDRALHERLARLTPREREVLALVVDGLLSKEIALQLGTALQTVKQHRSRIMQKLGARSVADLMRMVRGDTKVRHTIV